MTTTVTVRRKGSGSIVRVSELGNTTVLSFRAGATGVVGHDAVLRFFNREFPDLIADYQHVVVDLEGVVVLDSSSLGALISAREQLDRRGGSLVLCSLTSPRLREILRITCIDQVLPVYPDRTRAAAVLNR